MTWSGPMDPGDTVVITYQVMVNTGLAADVTLTNGVTAYGSDNSNRNGPAIPTNCTTGTEPGCTTTLDTIEPGLLLTKISNPPTGSAVKPGDTVTYTVTGTNTGNTDLDSVTLTDDLSKVLDKAVFITGSATATVDGQPAAAPTIQGTQLTWTGQLQIGQAVTLTYQVQVNATVANASVLMNSVTGVGTATGFPDVPVPVVCENTNSPVCSTTEIIDTGVKASTGGSVVTSTAAGLGGLGLMLLGGALVLLRKRAVFAK